MRGIWIGGSHDHARQLSGTDGLGAGRSAAVGRTRLERDIQRRTACGKPAAPGILQRFNLGVRPAGLAMPSAPQNGPAADEDGSDHGVGRSGAVAAPRKLQGGAHVRAMGGAGGHGHKRQSSKERRPVKSESAF